MKWRVVATVIVATSAVALSGCVSVPSTTSPHSAPTGSASGLTGSLTIFAAASLTASFTELAHNFAVDNPGVTVNPISFDGSSTLATQINEGAPADVFASADEANMHKVADFIEGSATVFASNVLQIAVQPGNPKGITRLADLAKPGILTVLCAPQVPCGTASHKLLDMDGVTVIPVSEEQNVKAVLTKVQLGEADAGLVYRTDIAAAWSAGAGTSGSAAWGASGSEAGGGSAGTVEGVNIAGADRAVNFYPIASLTGSMNPAVAHAFVDYVLSPEGESVLAKYGFGAP